MKKSWVIVTGIFLLNATNGAAGLKAPDFSLSTEEIDSKLEITAKAPERFHFNIKAPMKLTVNGATEKSVSAPVSEPVSKPVSKNEKLVKFRVGLAHFKEPGNGSFAVSLFLCDHANTICERHVVQAGWTERGLEVLKGGAAEIKGVGDSQNAQTVAQPTAESHGFILNDSAAALSKARNERKPLIIDFFGIWCPPCNELDEEVFSSAEFKRESKNFVKLKLDADSEVSWGLKSKYKVGGYPTVVFASADGDEIKRVVGFKPKKEFLKIVQEISSSRGSSFAALSEKAKSGDSQAMENVGLIHLERGEFAQAAAFLEKSKQYREKWFDAKAGAAEKDKGELRRWLAQAVLEFPKTPDSIARRIMLASIYPAETEKQKREETLGAAVAVALDLAAKPKSLEGSGFSSADIHSLTAEAYEALGDKASAKQAWSSAASEYEKYAKRLGSDKERGFNLEVAYALWKAGDIEKARLVYLKLQKHYPTEFTFYYGHARMCFEEKLFDEAYSSAKKAYDFSYGDNRIRSVHLLAQVLGAQGKKGEARRVTEETLAAVKLPEDSNIRTHKYVKALKELQGRL